MNWTFEEMELLRIYDQGSRLGTVSALEEIQPYITDEPETEELVKETLEKLEDMTDEDYYCFHLTLDPWEDDYGEDEEAEE